MTIFRIIFLSVSVVVFVYISQQLTRFADSAVWLKWGIIGLVFLLVAAFAMMPLFFWSDKGREKLEQYKWLQQAGFYALAMIGSLLSFVVLRDLLAFVGDIFDLFAVGPMYSSSVSLLFVGVSAGIVVFGRFRVNSGVRVERVEITNKKIPKSFAGFKILQISDLHISNFVGADFIKDVVEQVKNEGPDMVVLTGDIVDGDPVLLSEKIQLLSQISAQYGVFFVSGNHEFFWNQPKISSDLESCGFKDMDDLSLRIQKGTESIVLGGVSDPMARFRGKEGANVKKLSQEIQPESYNVLLAHQPFVADEASKLGFDLQLSGHTHGGQFFPWNLFIGFAQKYPKGLFKIGPLDLYVNQGTAYWGPAVRHGTFCELTLLRLNPEV